MDEVAAYFLSGVVFGSTEAPFVKGAEGVVIQGAVAAGAHNFGAFYAPVNAYNATHNNAPADSRITQRLRINRGRSCCYARRHLGIARNAGACAIANAAAVSCTVTAAAATSAACTNTAAAACAMAGSVTAAAATTAAFFCTCRHMLYYMLHNLLMLYLAIRQSNRFFLHDFLYLLLAIVGSISDSFIAASTASAAGVKEHHSVSIRSRRLHSKNAGKRQCDEQYKMYYQ